MVQKKSIFLFSILIFASSFCLAKPLPSKKEVLAQMKLTNAYFMNKWPDPGAKIVLKKTRPSNIWTRAVYYEGLMAYYKLNPDTAYYNYALKWGNAHQWGLNTGIKTRNADNHCCGQTYIDLYMMNPKPEKINDVKLSIDLMFLCQLL